MTTNNKPSEVIILDSDDDEFFSDYDSNEDDDFESMVAEIFSGVRRNKRVRTCEVVDLVSDDDEPRHPPNLRQDDTSNISQQNENGPGNEEMQSVCTPAVAVAIATAAPNVDSSPKNGIPVKMFIKQEYTPLKFGEADIIGELTEVDVGRNEGLKGIVSPPSALNESHQRQSNADDEEEIEYVGGNMQLASQMPHARESCPQFKFVHNIQVLSLKQCSQCYCFVCELKASECLEWKSHCMATYKNPVWKRERNARQSKILMELPANVRAQIFVNMKGVLDALVLVMAESSSSVDGRIHSYMINNNHLISIISSQSSVSLINASELIDTAYRMYDLNSISSHDIITMKNLVLEACVKIVTSLRLITLGDQSQSTLYEKATALLVHIFLFPYLSSNQRITFKEDISTIRHTPPVLLQVSNLLFEVTENLDWLQPESVVMKQTLNRKENQLPKGLETLGDTYLKYMVDALMRTKASPRAVVFVLSRMSSQECCCSELWTLIVRTVEEKRNGYLDVVAHIVSQINEKLWTSLTSAVASLYPRDCGNGKTMLTILYVLIQSPIAAKSPFPLMFANKLLITVFANTKSSTVSSVTSANTEIISHILSKIQEGTKNKDISYGLFCWMDEDEELSPMLNYPNTNAFREILIAILIQLPLLNCSFITHNSSSETKVHSKSIRNASEKEALSSFLVGVPESATLTILNALLVVCRNKFSTSNSTEYLESICEIAACAFISFHPSTSMSVESQTSVISVMPTEILLEWARLPPLATNCSLDSLMNQLTDISLGGILSLQEAAKIALTLIALHGRTNRGQMEPHGPSWEWSFVLPLQILFKALLGYIRTLLFTSTLSVSVGIISPIETFYSYFSTIQLVFRNPFFDSSNELILLQTLQENFGTSKNSNWWFPFYVLYKLSLFPQLQDNDFINHSVIYFRNAYKLISTRVIVLNNGLSISVPTANHFWKRFLQFMSASVTHNQISVINILLHDWRNIHMAIKEGTGNLIVLIREFPQLLPEDFENDKYTREEFEIMLGELCKSKNVILIQCLSNIFSQFCSIHTATVHRKRTILDVLMGSQPTVVKDLAIVTMNPTIIEYFREFSTIEHWQETKDKISTIIHSELSRFSNVVAHQNGKFLKQQISNSYIYNRVATPLTTLQTVILCELWDIAYKIFDFHFKGNINTSIEDKRAVLVNVLRVCTSITSLTRTVEIVLDWVREISLFQPITSSSSIISYMEVIEQIRNKFDLSKNILSLDLSLIEFICYTHLPLQISLFRQLTSCLSDSLSRQRMFKNLYDWVRRLFHQSYTSPKISLSDYIEIICILGSAGSHLEVLRELILPFWKLLLCPDTLNRIFSLFVVREYMVPLGYWLVLLLFEPIVQISTSVRACFKSYFTHETIDALLATSVNILSSAESVPTTVLTTSTTKSSTSSKNTPLQDIHKILSLSFGDIVRILGLISQPTVENLSILLSSSTILPVTKDRILYLGLDICDSQPVVEVMLRQRNFSQMFDFLMRKDSMDMATSLLDSLTLTLSLEYLIPTRPSGVCNTSNLSISEVEMFLFIDLTQTNSFIRYLGLLLLKLGDILESTSAEPDPQLLSRNPPEMFVWKLRLLLQKTLEVTKASPLITVYLQCATYQTFSSKSISRLYTTIRQILKVSPAAQDISHSNGDSILLDLVKVLVEFSGPVMKKIHIFKEIMLISQEESLCHHFSIFQDDKSLFELAFLALSVCSPVSKNASKEGVILWFPPTNAQIPTAISQLTKAVQEVGTRAALALQKPVLEALRSGSIRSSLETTEWCELLDTMRTVNPQMNFMYSLIQLKRSLELQCFITAFEQASQMCSKQIWLDIVLKIIERHLENSSFEPAGVSQAIQILWLSHYPSYVIADGAQFDPTIVKRIFERMIADSRRPMVISELLKVAITNKAALKSILQTYQVLTLAITSDFSGQELLSQQYILSPLWQSMSELNIQDLFLKCISQVLEYVHTQRVTPMIKSSFESFLCIIKPMFIHSSSSPVEVKLWKDTMEHIRKTLHKKKAIIGVISHL